MNSKPNLKALEKNIVDTIKESQLKLGFTPNPVTLFLPAGVAKPADGR